MSDPNYMEHVPMIAEQYGKTQTLNYLGSQLQELWVDFESFAKAYSYDIFNPDPRMHRAMCDLVSNLYRLPGAGHGVDVNQLFEKNAAYGGSWCSRGGIGAFMMLARKWDRIAEAFKKEPNLGVLISKDNREEGVLDDFGDLRRYLVLVLAWHYAVEHPIQQVGFEF